MFQASYKKKICTLAFNLQNQQLDINYMEGLTLSKQNPKHTENAGPIEKCYCLLDS